MNNMIKCSDTNHNTNSYQQNMNINNLPFDKDFDFDAAMQALTELKQCLLAAKEHK